MFRKKTNDRRGHDEKKPVADGIKHGNKAQKDTILQGRILPPLIRFTLPLILSVLIQALYGAVDLIVVGNFGSTASVSAVSNGSQIMHTVTSVIIGLSTGVTVLVGNRIGADDKKSAANAVGAMIKLFAVAAIALSVLMMIFAKDIARIMLVPDEAMSGAVTYLRVCSAGMLFICAFNAISALFRGVGNSKSPLLFITIACVLNIILDLLFCGAFGMDVFGAALATVIAQAASVAFSINRMRHGGLPFRLTAQNFKNSSAQIKQILKIGSPLATQEFLVGVSFLIIMAIINDISLVASASIGIAEKLFLFLAIIPMSFSSSLSVFVAQNMGAQQKDRAMRGTAIACGISLTFGLAMTALTYFGGEMLAGIFEKNQEVISATADYLRGVSFEYMLLPISFCLIGYFNGTQRTSFVMMEGVLSAFLIRIPASYFLSRRPGASLFTIALAIPMAALASLIAYVVYFLHVRKKPI